MESLRPKVDVADHIDSESLPASMGNGNGTLLDWKWGWGRR